MRPVLTANSIGVAAPIRFKSFSKRHSSWDILLISSNIDRGLDTLCFSSPNIDRIVAPQNHYITQNDPLVNSRGGGAKSQACF
jgi:hypothetical protein